MNTLRLLFVFFRVSVLNETAYRVNFFVQLFQSFLQLGTTLAGLGVIFSYTNNLAGWRPDEMLALVSPAARQPFTCACRRRKNPITRRKSGTTPPGRCSSKRRAGG